MARSRIRKEENPIVFLHLAFELSPHATTAMLRAISRIAQPAAARASLSRGMMGTALRVVPRGQDAPLSRRLSTAAEEDVDVDNVAYGFMASQALFTGLETGVFDAIAASPNGSLDLAGLQDAVKSTAPRLQTLLTSLVAIKCLRRDAAGAYTLSPNTARFLVLDAKHYYGDYLRYQMGRQFYHRMGALPDVMLTGEAPSYASWFSDPETAKTYTQAQHNGSMATAKYLIKKKLQLDGAKTMLDVGGGSGAFSYVFTDATPELTSTVLELPEVCRTGEGIKETMSPSVQERVKFVELDATSPDWPVNDTAFDVVLMSYISGSVPEAIIQKLYANAFKALKPGGRLLVCPFPPTSTRHRAPTSHSLLPLCQLPCPSHSLRAILYTPH